MNWWFIESEFRYRCIQIIHEIILTVIIALFASFLKLLKDPSYVLDIFRLCFRLHKIDNKFSEILSCFILKH